jgi:hypothetical protein
LLRLKKKLNTGINGNRIISIGVIAASEAAGCTSVAVSLAMFLHHIKGYQVAIVEKSPRKSFRKMALLEHATHLCCYSHKLNNVDFFYENIDSHIHYNEKLNNCFANYEYIVTDYGKYSDSTLGEVFNCDYQVIVASLQGWKCNDTKELLSKLDEYGNKRCFKNSVCIIQGTEKALNDVRKHRKVCVKSMPYISDSTRLNNELVDFYKNII